MGVDIHIKMCHIPTQKVVHQKLYDGRNSEWFGELQGRRHRQEYNHFPVFAYELPSYADIDDLAAEKEAPINGHYGFCSVKVDQLFQWYAECQPALHAGWVHKIDKWNYEHKGMIPDEVYSFLPMDARIEDWEFIEYTDDFDPMTAVLRVVEEVINSVGDVNPANYMIYYFFDC